MELHLYAAPIPVFWFFGRFYWLAQTPTIYLSCWGVPVTEQVQLQWDFLKTSSLTSEQLCVTAGKDWSNSLHCVLKTHLRIKRHIRIFIVKNTDHWMKGSAFLLIVKLSVRSLAPPVFLYQSISWNWKKNKHGSFCFGRTWSRVWINFFSGYLHHCPPTKGVEFTYILYGYIKVEEIHRHWKM